MERQCHIQTEPQSLDFLLQKGSPITRYECYCKQLCSNHKTAYLSICAPSDSIYSLLRPALFSLVARLPHCNAVCVADISLEMCLGSPALVKYVFVLG